MTLVDWRDVGAGDLEPLLAAECDHWRRRLDWDLDPSMHVVESARRDGRLPGFVLRDGDGRATGWAFHVLHDGILQVGGLVAPTGVGVRALLRAVCASPEAGAARSLRGFLFPRSASVANALIRQRFALTRHLYLTCPLRGQVPASAQAGPGVELGPIEEADRASVVRLAAAAYAGAPEARCFAPDGRLDQWAHYFGQLFNTPGVGWYLPPASCVARIDGRAAPAAALVATAVSHRTAHVAQVVVDPRAQRRGLGRLLVQQALAAAARAGFEQVTLLVDEANAPARGLYGALGFLATAEFLYAVRPALSRRVQAAVHAPSRLPGS